MISKTPEERQFYDDRQKYLLDEESRMRGARLQGLEEGMEEGLKKGGLAGKIQVFEQLLGESETPMSDLTARSLTDLTERLQQLQERMRRLEI